MIYAVIGFKAQFAINNIRTLCTLFIGTATGIYGFDGPSGIAFYALCDFLIGVMIYAVIGFKAQPYFASASDVILSGFGGNFMTFMVTWVFFFNLVYVL